jgi:glycosyltransferase involved in cell wall biosynthesis
MHIIRNKPVVLAPRGEFSPGAIGLKIFKKKIYINLAKALGLYKDVRWHATSKEEKKDIEDLFGKVKEIVIANNLTADYKNLNYEKSIKKTRGNLKLIYISRIHPKKNLKMGIDLLRHVKGNVEFNIFGPIENSVYWTKCKRAIDSLPENIKVSYNGVVEHVNIVDVFKGQHVLLFPTLGENFGHVISEALIGGCPVIISDQTPWKHLEQEQVGWEIKLNNREKFIATIQKCINLDNGEYQLLSKNAFNYAKRISNNQQEIKKYRDLFLSI